MELKNHWIRILILISYFVLVFIISRILDLVLWCHHGYLPTDLVDPIVLNVRQLKQVLDSRGISYTGVLEKPQLVELLYNSAHILKGELDELVGTKQNTSQLLPPSTHFTGGSHFNEKVEDAKDSVWLVQVIPVSKRNEPLLDDYSWRYLKHQLAPFAIQTGVFDCALDRELCVRRNWLEPILLLALPRGNRPKDHVVIRTSKTPKIHMIIKWVKEQLSSRVTKIISSAQLEEDWLSTSHKSDDLIKVVLLSHLLHTPLFFAALSIKFSGRIKFGIFSVKRDEDNSGLRKLVARYPHVAPLPAYLVITPEKTHRYGHWPAEHLNMLQMNLFLKLLVPEINDIFLVALLLTNMLALIDICQMRYTSRLIYLLMRTLLLLIGYNLTLFSVSLLFYNLSLPLFPLVPLLRYVNFSYAGALIRSDLLSLYAHPIYFVGYFLVYSFLMGKRFPCKETTSWDFLPLGNSFFNFLFRPSEPPSVLFTSDLHFDLRFEQFVLSAPRFTQPPNLWLQTSVPRVDYVSDLPVFEYKGWRACPHKGMKMICRVMDGAEPALLTFKDEGITRRDVDTNDTRGILLSNTNTQTGSISNLRERRSDVPSSRDAGTCTQSCNRNSSCSHGEYRANNPTSVNLNIPNEATLSDEHSNIPSQKSTSVRKRNSSNVSSSQNSCDNINNSNMPCHSHSTDNISPRSDSNTSRVSKRKHMTSTSEDNSGGVSSNENTSTCRNYTTNSRSNDCFVRNRQDESPLGSTTEGVPHKHVSTREDGKLFSNEEAEDCDYLECRLIRSKDCAICLEPYVEGTILLALPCAHHYHKSCILSWLERVAQCPVCRWPAYDQKYDFSY